jgi:hypothetical protein
MRDYLTEYLNEDTDTGPDPELDYPRMRPKQTLRREENEEELQDQSQHVMKMAESTGPHVFGITSKRPSCSFPISTPIPENIGAMQDQLARTRHLRPCTWCSTSF